MNTNTQIKNRVNEILTEKIKLSKEYDKKCNDTKRNVAPNKDCIKQYNKYLIYLVKYNALTGNDFLSEKDLKQIKEHNLDKEIKKLGKDIDKKIEQISKQKTLISKQLSSNIATCSKNNKCPSFFNGYEKAMRCEAKLCEKQGRAIIKFNEDYKKQFGLEKLLYSNKFLK
jgi:hypothetical protein